MTEVIFILAPFGKDAVLSSEFLEKEGYKTRIIKSIREVSLADIHSCGAIMATEEAFSLDEFRQFQVTLSKQEPWSDLPVLLLINSKDQIAKNRNILDSFSTGANFLLVERPFRLLTLITTINVALRSRRRQYLVKQLLRDQQVSLKARDEFLSIASHELKTPITTLKLQVQMRRRFLKKGDQSVYNPDKVNQFIDFTDHQVGRLERLVDDMLDVSRIEIGKLTLNREKTDLSELVQKTYHALHDEFVNAECPVEMTLNKVEGYWDRYRVEQATVNLFTNAIKYGQGYKITIAVYAEGNKAVLTVADEGMGIAPENQVRIFDRFERAVEGGNISGLGLGLYITKAIIEVQGGTIGVESQLGMGAKFKITLPLGPAPGSS